MCDWETALRMSLPGAMSLWCTKQQHRAFHLSCVRVMLPVAQWACLCTSQQPQKSDILAVCRGAAKVDKLLTEDEFTFMKNECARDKWVVVELTARVRVASIEILMIELYSSRVKDFDVYGSSSKPTVATGETGPWNAAWYLLGHFQAVNKKGAQVGASAFLLALPRLVADNHTRHVSP
jgi:hypothetical protein